MKLWTMPTTSTVFQERNTSHTEKRNRKQMGKKERTRIGIVHIHLFHISSRRRGDAKIFTFCSSCCPSWLLVLLSLIYFLIFQNPCLFHFKDTQTRNIAFACWQWNRMDSLPATQHAVPNLVDSFLFTRLFIHSASLYTLVGREWVRLGTFAR